jgi:hypothetical protein
MAFIAGSLAIDLRGKRRQTGANTSTGPFAFWRRALTTLGTRSRLYACLMSLNKNAARLFAGRRYNRATFWLAVPLRRRHSRLLFV